VGLGSEGLVRAARGCRVARARQPDGRVEDAGGGAPRVVCWPAPPRGLQDDDAWAGATPRVVCWRAYTLMEYAVRTRKCGKSPLPNRMLACPPRGLQDVMHWQRRFQGRMLACPPGAGCPPRRMAARDAWQRGGGRGKGVRQRVRRR
jgi:hypothetical protein